MRGLLSLGVRQGEHVGVLMRTRPSAIAAEAGAATVLVLGGGAQPRELGGGLIDMERIDPGAVDVPTWFAPNPGRTGDLAFILFTGFGARTRVNRVTNGRWAVAAFGTASSAALSKADTVYAVTPIYHPSGLLMSVGGAIAGGARLALAEGFDADTYWDEVRRYGVTVGSYAWTMLRELVERPPDRSERHRPVRLFIGSGMPRGLWRRVEERFAPARVLEFYTSTEGEAVLVNVADTKPGAEGRPLPGGSADRLRRAPARGERGGLRRRRHAATAQPAHGRGHRGRAGSARAARTPTDRPRRARDPADDVVTGRLPRRCASAACRARAAAPGSATATTIASSRARTGRASPLVTVVLAQHVAVGESPAW